MKVASYRLHRSYKDESEPRAYQPISFCSYYNHIMYYYWNKNKVQTRPYYRRNPYSAVQKKKKIETKESPGQLVQRILLRTELQICFLVAIRALTSISAYFLNHLFFSFNFTNINLVVPLDRNVVIHNPPCHFAQSYMKTWPLGLLMPQHSNSAQLSAISDISQFLLFSEGFFLSLLFFKDTLTNINRSRQFN